MFCFDFKDSNFPYIIGEEDLDEFSQILISLKKCDQNDKKSKCSEDSEIDFILEDSKFNIYWDHKSASP